MHRFRLSLHASRRTGLIAVGAGALVVAGCSSASEEGIEQLIESQSGGDVELDLDGDGGFSFESEDGSFSVDEDGNFVIEDESGEVVTGQANDEGFVVETEDGETITGDIGDDGIVVESDEGSFSAESDGDGDFVVESDEGTFEFQEGGDLPDEWPSDIPTPDGLTITESAFLGDGTSGQSTVTGSVDDSAADFVNSYGAALQDAGLIRSSFTQDGSDVVATYMSDAFTVSVIGTESTGDQQIVVSVLSNG